MVRVSRVGSRFALSGLIALGALLAAERRAAAASDTSARSLASSGGAAIGGLPPSKRRSANVPPPPSKHDHGSWVSGVTATEYWPAPESWFVGALVTTPGLPTRHRIDWLYSATGVSMEGQGFGLDGRMYHIDALGRGGWVTLGGVGTSPSDGWSAGPPYWRAGGFWRNSSGGVTFPLQTGGWARGTGRRYVPLPGVTFAAGSALPIHFYESIAVDPSVIPLGSRVYVPAYRHDGHGGWFVAQDTGGGIGGRHIDVYRSPPASPNSGGQYLTRQRIYVIRPRHH
jgi:3D (Asp-Asp-Asp) domain-containing protein